MLNELKAEFSHAYVRAVSNAAGLFIQESNRQMDHDGIDLTIFKRHPSKKGLHLSRLDVQLKATAKPLPDDVFYYDLPVKNYDELRHESLQVPRILVLVIVPKDIEHWVSTSEEHLILRHCGYWISLRGASPTDNKNTVRIKLDKTKYFNVSQLSSIMERIHEGGLP